jgi:hypothetical protein
MGARRGGQVGARGSLGFALSPGRCTLPRMTAAVIPRWRRLPRSDRAARRAAVVAGRRVAVDHGGSIGNGVAVAAARASSNAQSMIDGGPRWVIVWTAERAPSPVQLDHLAQTSRSRPANRVRASTGHDDHDDRGPLHVAPTGPQAVSTMVDAPEGTCRRLRDSRYPSPCASSTTVHRRTVRLSSGAAARSGNGTCRARANRPAR